MKRRVVVTGMGAITHYGYGVDKLVQGIYENTEKPIMYPIEIDKEKYIDLPVYLVDKNIWCDYLNKMPNAMYKNLTRMATFVCMAADNALPDSPKINNFNVGISVASSLPSMYEFEDLLNIVQNNPKKMPTSTIFRTLNNNVAFNLAKYLKVDGRIISSSSACATSLQSIILGYETIKLGKANVMVCGGSEEYHPQLSRVFHKLGIASKTKCKPFQNDRDGIAIAEGAGIVILEDYNHARDRGATIYAEILGSGQTFTYDSAFSDYADIDCCMREAISEYEYFDNIINSYNRIIHIDAHATGTLIGDDNELQGIHNFTKRYNFTPKISALKEYLGHTMAACGVIELIASIQMHRLNKISTISGFKDLTKQPRLLLKNSFGL